MLPTYLNDTWLLAPSMLLNDNVGIAAVDDESFDITLSREAARDGVERIRRASTGQ